MIKYKYYILALLLLFLKFQVGYSQSDEILSTIDSVLSTYSTENYEILEHGGNFTNSLQVIIPTVSSFKSKYKYNLITLFDNCENCKNNVDFIFDSNYAYKVPLRSSKNSTVKISTYKFLERKKLEGHFEINVNTSDTTSNHYTYYILIREI